MCPPGGRENKILDYSEDLEKGHPWGCFQWGRGFLDLWRVVLLTLRARKRSSGVQREQVMPVPSDCRL